MSCDLGIVADVVCLACLKEHGIVDDGEIGMVHTGGQDGKTRTTLDRQLTTTGGDGCPGDVT